MNEKTLDVLASVDAGKSHMKISVWQQGKIKSFSFKSWVRIGVPSVSMIGRNDGGRADVFKLANEVFTVSGDAINPLNIKKEGPDSLAVKALTLAGLSRAGLADQRVCLATNLPLGEFVIRDANGLMGFNENLQDKKINALRYTDHDLYLSSKEGVPQISKGVVSAEGFAAYIDSVVSESGEINEPKGKKRGILDIGGGSTEIGIFSQDFKIDDNFITLDIGTLEVNRLLERYILSKWTEYEKIEPIVLEHCIKTGEFTDLKGEQHDLSEVVEDCKQKLARKIIQEAHHRLKDNIDFLDQILLVGGGGQMLKQYFAEWELITVPKQPEFSNSRGLLKLITFLSGIEEGSVSREVPEVEGKDKTPVLSDVLA